MSACACNELRIERGVLCGGLGTRLSLSCCLVFALKSQEIVSPCGIAFSLSVQMTGSVAS